MALFEERPMTDLADLAEDLIFEFPDFPARTVIHYLRRAAFTMCRDGDLVTHEAPLTTIPRVENYKLDPPDEMEINSILKITEAGRRPVARLTGRPAAPFRVTVSWFTPPDTLYIINNFTRPEDYLVLFSAVPARDACQIDAGLAGQVKFLRMRSGKRKGRLCKR